MPRIIMNRGFIARWTRMPHSIGRLSISVSSHHSLSSAAFTTNIAESDFRHAQRQVMAANDKIIDPHLDWSEQVKSIRLEVDQDRARALGLTPQDVAQTLQTLFNGLTVTQYREGIENIDVVARAIPSERLELDRLPSLTIATRNGTPVPLSQIARLNYEYEEPILWRRNRDIVLIARGEWVDGVQPPDGSKV